MEWAKAEAKATINGDLASN